MTHKLLVTLLALAALSAAPRKQTFIGIITDSTCGSGGHASMRMGPTDAECTTACVAAHGSVYVLIVGKNEYTLSNQQTPEQFAARKVKIVGTLDVKSRTITVASITAWK